MRLDKTGHKNVSLVTVFAPQSSFSVKTKMDAVVNTKTVHVCHLLASVVTFLLSVSKLICDINQK